MKKRNKKVVLFLILLLSIIGIGSAYAYYQVNVIVPNKYKAATYEVEIEEEFEDKFGVKKVWIVNKEKTNAPVVLRVNYNELWSKEIDGVLLTLDNNVNGENVVEKEWTEEFLNDFELKEDGWYYYKKVLRPEERVQLLERISLKNELISTSEYSNEYLTYDYELAFNFESIQATEDAVLEIWNKNITINDDNVTW